MIEEPNDERSVRSFGRNYRSIVVMQIGNSTPSHTLTLLKQKVILTSPFDIPKFRNRVTTSPIKYIIQIKRGRLKSKMKALRIA